MRLRGHTNRSQESEVQGRVSERTRTACTDALRGSSRRSARALHRATVHPAVLGPGPGPSAPSPAPTTKAGGPPDQLLTLSRDHRNEQGARPGSIPGASASLCWLDAIPRLTSARGRRPLSAPPQPPAAEAGGPRRRPRCRAWPAAHAGTPPCTAPDGRPRAAAPPPGAAHGRTAPQRPRLSAGPRPHCR